MTRDDIIRIAKDAGFSAMDSNEAADGFGGVFDAEGQSITWETLRFAAAIIERCAQAIEPKDNRPCDCDICDCGNNGRLRALDLWDVSSVNAELIRQEAEGLKP